tara:strand:- start:134 stop:346 length:213 start_codon:yes stop_codon:yes gene_type:complete
MQALIIAAALSLPHNDTFTLTEFDWQHFRSVPKPGVFVRPTRRLPLFRPINRRPLTRREPIARKRQAVPR